MAISLPKNCKARDWMASIRKSPGLRESLFSTLKSSTLEQRIRRMYETACADKWRAVAYR